MRLGKYLTNLGVLGSLAGAYGVAKQTRKMPADWRRVIVWTVWALGVVLAVGAVVQDEHDDRNQVA